MSQRIELTYTIKETETTKITCSFKARKLFGAWWHHGMSFPSVEAFTAWTLERSARLEMEVEG